MAEEHQPVKIFCSCAEADKEFCRPLETHLGGLKRSGLITQWYHHSLSAGKDKAQEAKDHLKSAQIILFLISADFLYSNYSREAEMELAMQRHRSGEARVIPILLRAVDWEDHLLYKLQALPSNGRPVVTPEGRASDEAFVDIAKGIRQVVKELFPQHFEVDRARVKYLQGVIEHYSTVKLPLGPPGGFSLHAIFQPLVLRSDPPTDDELEHEQRRRFLGETTNDEVSTPLQKERGRMKAQGKRRRQALKIVGQSEEAIQESPQRRLIILGGPGTGKTTTLKYLIERQAHKALADSQAALPIYISLADLARRDKTLPNYLVDVVQEMGSERRFAETLWQHIEQGQAFLCLDGLDEVSPNARSVQIEHINVWVADRRNTWVIGSRFTDYKGEQFRHSQFKEWELLPLNHDLRMELANRLLPEIRRHVSHALTASISPDTFITALEQHPQAAAWGDNPLLLSLAAIVFMKTHTLPESRAMLYHEVFEAILRAQEPDVVRHKLLARKLGEFALWLYEQKKGRTYRVEDLLEFLIDRHHSETDVEDLAHRILASRVIEPLAHNTYGFRHATFQEYFAARELARRLSSQDSSMCESAWELIWERHTYSRWSEILRLMVGILLHYSGQRGGAVALRWLRDLREEYATSKGDPGDLGLSLALTSLSECTGEVARERTHLRLLAETILARWLDSVLSISRGKRRQRLSERARDVAHFPDYLLQQAVEYLLRVQQHDRSFMRVMAVEMLGMLGERVDVAPLLAALQDKEADVRASAVKALGQRRDNVPLDQLVAALQDQYMHVHMEAEKALKKQSHRFSSKTLLEMLQWEAGGAKVVALEALEQRRETIPLDLLVAALHHSHGNVREAAVKALKGQSRSLKPEILWEMLQQEERGKREAAVRVLGQRGELSLDQLVAALQDEDWDVRKAAIDVIEERKIEISWNDVSKALENGNADVRKGAVRLVGERWHEGHLDVFLKMLQDEDNEVVETVLEVLEQRKEEVPLYRLLTILHYKDWNIQDVIESPGEAGEEVFLTSLLTAAQHEGWSVQKGALDSLEEQSYYLKLLYLLSQPQQGKEKLLDAAFQVLEEKLSNVPVELLVEMLKNKNWLVKMVIIAVIDERGEKAPIEVLLEMLYDRYWRIRCIAVYALTIGEIENDIVVNELLAALHDTNCIVRKAVVETLGQQKGKTLQDMLLIALHDGDNDVRSAVLNVLKQRAAEVLPEVWLTFLQMNNEERSYAMMVVLEDKGQKEIREAWVTMLQDKDVNVQGGIARVQNYLKPEAFLELLQEKAWRVLCAVVCVPWRRKSQIWELAMSPDSEWEVQWTVARALERQNHHLEPKEALGLLQDKDWRVRYAAAKALAERREGSINRWSTLLWDDHWKVQEVAVAVLEQREKDVSSDTWLALLQTGARGAREVAREVLRRRGEEVPQEIVLTMLQSWDDGVRQIALEVLEGQHIEPQKLLKILQENRRVRYTVVAALKQRGKDVSSNIWLALLQDEEDRMRYEAVKALEQREAEVERETWLTMLRDENEDVRCAVVEVLGKRGEKIQQETWLAALQDPSCNVRKATVKALEQRRGEVPPEAWSALLQDEHGEVRAATVKVLAQHAEISVKLLTAFIGDEDSRVRAQALAALRQKAGNISSVMQEATDVFYGRPAGPILASITKGFIAEILGQLGIARREVFDYLERLLDWHFWQVRVKAAKALGQIQRNVPETTIKRLLELRLDPDPMMRAVREAANDALAEILSLETGIEDNG
jgi:HEAT repeat protein